MQAVLHGAIQVVPLPKPNRSRQYEKRRAVCFAAGATLLQCGCKSLVLSRGVFDRVWRLIMDVAEQGVEVQDLGLRLRLWAKFVRHILQT